MLITFHSKAYENITYFGDIAKVLLTLMGHSGTIPGAFKAADLPQALEKLQNKLGKHDNASQSNEDDYQVELSKRAIPLINMLQASIQNNCDILWDA